MDAYGCIWMHVDVVVQPRHLQIGQTVPAYFSPLSHSLWVTTVSFCLIPCPRGYLLHSIVNQLSVMST